MSNEPTRRLFVPDRVAREQRNADAAAYLAAIERAELARVDAPEPGVKPRHAGPEQSPKLERRRRKRRKAQRQARKRNRA